MTLAVRKRSHRKQRNILTSRWYFKYTLKWVAYLDCITLCRKVGLCKYGRNFDSNRDEKKLWMKKGTVAKIEVRFFNNGIMTIKFKVEFLQIKFVGDLIILLRLILLCKVYKLISILGQRLLLFMFVRLWYKFNLTLIKRYHNLSVIPNSNSIFSCPSQVSFRRYSHDF